MSTDNSELLGLNTGFVTFKDDKPQEERKPRKEYRKKEEEAPK